MAANKKFTPRASSNLIDEGVADVTSPVDESTVDEVKDDESVTVEATDKTPEPDNKDSDTTVTFTAETNKKPIEKMVKIRLAKKYDGCIGGEWYHFAKEQVVTVPENVKRILNEVEGMLKPL